MTGYKLRPLGNTVVFLLRARSSGRTAIPPIPIYLRSLMSVVMTHVVLSALHMRMGVKFRHVRAASFRISGNAPAGSHPIAPPATRLNPNTTSGARLPSKGATNVGAPVNPVKLRDSPRSVSFAPELSYVPMLVAVIGLFAKSLLISKEIDPRLCRGGARTTHREVS